ncbi:hypothetical protein [Methermicoccus shengliensis]|uniref:Uncharacterized protein n=1 Tax=Methermicoccus shengliensis TaxID=660064 RepID=A0A832RS83_9EURY|nr:hypothetical protein [Methermicoccus shengliensis]KUK05129.1 MAG: Uncharacterized protein XD46_0122 [Euryarchaeota archaeon 55_53]KUK30695.1 MAG: Uncharacterized protein XD62_0204 [Methanosarcinales archeaon 56_1174]MDI3487289.1 hypothetical protein [Methanosarcinales archaeon]MDN5294636.1 hypothetical protein [Methanosarcinales archaeon]HIH69343.1 hypothetical protein [Methermicoccus shengliensis]
MECSKCGGEIKPEEAVKIGNRVLCEDCYFDEIDRVRTCDPWAVMLAKKAKTGKKLTQRQQAIYDIVKERGKAKIEEIAKELGIRGGDVEREIAVLRHLELVKGRKEGNEVFIVPFDS